MHVLVAFIIGIAMYSTFNPVLPTEKGSWDIQTTPVSEFYIQEPIRPLSSFITERIVKQSYDYSCGSAALATVLKYYLGENFSEREVIHGLLQHGDPERIKKRRAFSLLDMKKFVNKLGYEANGYKGAIEDVMDPEFWPCIVPIKIFDYRHFVVVKGVHKGHIFLVDPWRGHTSYTIGQFEKMWYQNVLFVISSNNGEQYNALKLTVDDLRYVDEDVAIRIQYDQVVEMPPIDILQQLDEYTEHQGTINKQYYKY